ALALAMAFHELATNAVKYGALANATGEIELAWQPDGEQQEALLLEWREQGGPAVVAPQRRGFGSVLLTRALEQDLGGRVDLAFHPAGLACSIVLPLAAPGRP